MAPYTPGPKEQRLKELKAARLAKPSTAALRGSIAKIKGSNQKLRKGGRKR